MTYRHADINMDTVRDFSHIGQGNPRVPTSPSLEEDLFLEYFDWSAYCRATQPFEAAPSHYPSSSSSRDLSTLITEIPAVLDSLSIDKRGGRFFNMKTPFNHDEDAVTISEYSGQTPPELVRGGSTSSSDHPSSPPRDRSEDYRHRSDITLREVQAQDDEWTYPQSVSPKAAPRAYPPRLQVSEYQKAGGSHDHASGLKRRRAGDSSEKRHRQLANPVQTAIVRKSGACLPCRVTKIAVRHLLTPNLQPKLTVSLSVMTMASAQSAGLHSLITLTWSALGSPRPWLGQCSGSFQV